MHGGFEPRRANNQLGVIVEEDGFGNGQRPPNRGQFEGQLQAIHTTIDAIRKEIKRKAEQCLATNPIREEMKLRRRELSEKLDALKKECDQLRIQLDEKKRAALELEKDCKIRRRDTLEMYLKNLEDRYHTMDLSIRDEHTLVQEIDALKRNRAKLDKLEEISKTRTELTKRYDEVKKSRHALLHQSGVIKVQTNEVLMERRKTESEISNLRKDLSDLYRKRHSLIGDYQADRDSYKKWRTSNIGSPNSFPSTFPSANRQKSHESHLEDEELEPFFEQKRDCKRLINYLEQLKSLLPKEDLEHNSLVQQISTDEDSADEFPAHLAKIASGQKMPPIKKHIKKVKTTQPISHQIDIYKLFGSVEVKAPQLFSDVPTALLDVKEKLAFYEQQTNEIDWKGDDLGLGSMSLSHTASDFTDSLYDGSLSETASIASSRHESGRANCQSPISPLAETRRPFDSSDPDEGCSSK